MSQIFDKQLYTPELKKTLQRIIELGYTATTTCELLTAAEFFKTLETVNVGLYIYVYTRFDTNPHEICRCNSIIEAINSQTPLPIPYIMPQKLGDIPPVDGCHRMYVCEKLFAPDTKFPVLVLTTSKKPDEKEITYAKNRYN